MDVTGPKVAMLSPEREGRVREHLDQIKDILSEECIEQGAIFCDGSEDLRWELHVLAASINDFTFWVREQEMGGKLYFRATEIESGVSAYGESPRDALTNYFDGNLDRPQEEA